MSPGDFSNTAVVLLGHGSSLKADAAAPVFQHAAALRQRTLFAAVREAFWKQEPRIQDVLASLGTARVFIVPLFMSEGYFSRQIIPAELGFASGHSKLKTQNSELHYCLPIGTDPRLADVVLARAREVVRQFPFPRAPEPRETTLFIAGHGTLQNENSRESIEDQAGRVRELAEYAGVHAIFLEESPRIDECYRLAQTRNVVVVPFFISEGMHTREDIPRLLGEADRTVRERVAAGKPTWRNPSEKQGKRVWLASAAGTSPKVVEIILARVRETAKVN